MLNSLVERARSEYDFVLIDSPPILPVSDAAVIATRVDATVMVVNDNKTQRKQLVRALELLRHVDGVVLVLRAGRTSRDTAVLAKERFMDDGTPIFGTILNDWNAKTRSGYAYNGYYKGYYDYHGNGAKTHSSGT